MATPQTRPSIGSIGWYDLTVPNAEEVHDFYSAVVGWATTPVDMGGYHDFCMNEPESGEAVAGICHSRGVNADVPSQWLMYITVANLEASLAQVAAHGGAVVREPKGGAQTGHYAIIRDPAGAVAMLFQPPD